jgi:copper oxidase (laccase) domain-containing protein
MINLKSSIKDIRAIIGPCIRQESYEVDRSFYESFLCDNKENKSYFVSSSKINHFMFNLPLYCINKLEKLGIKEIEDKKIDTYKNKKDFFSYRQRKSTNERNISVVTT